MNSKALIQKNKHNNKNDSTINFMDNINLNNNSSSIKMNTNLKIPISINKKLKSIFKYALNEIGIDIMNPKNFIDELLNMYLQEENLIQETKEHRTKVENFVKTFIYLLVNWKFSFLENAFDVKENILKLLLKKQIFKCNYLNNSTIEEYKKNEKLQERNLFVIYNVIKSIEYKYNIPIVGIENYQSNKENVYSLEIKFHWFIKFVDYFIILYLSDDSIIPFSHFINEKKLRELIETFDKDKNFNLSYFFNQENADKFKRKIIYIVENVIYNLINNK
jgi:hypothetical protein